MKRRHDRDLERLRALRLKREERALEQVARRQHALRQAEAAVEDAGNAIKAHIEHANQKEQEVTKGLIGRVVRQQALDRVRLEFEVLAYKYSELRDTQKKARNAQEKSEHLLERAQGIYRKHRLETEKLRMLLHQRELKYIWRQTALTEAAIGWHRMTDNGLADMKLCNRE
jgi:hypothetical protein